MDIKYFWQIAVGTIIGMRIPDEYRDNFIKNIRGKELNQLSEKQKKYFSNLVKESGFYRKAQEIRAKLEKSPNDLKFLSDADFYFSSLEKNGILF